MALVLANRVQESGTANTTVSFTLTGAVTGFQSFSAIGNGNTTYYSATDASGNWEVGLGTYSTTGPTLTRTTVYASSNSGSAVTFSGAVNVFVTYPSGRSVNLDGSGNVSALGTVTSGTWQGSTVGVAYGGTGVITSSGPNSVVLRDANENITVNRLSQGLQTITASGGVTTLTAASDFNQLLTGTGNHTFRLPDATTLTDTTTFQFNNNATGTLTIQNNAGTTVGSVAPGGAAGIALLNNATVGGTWDVHGYIPENITWGTNSLYLASDIVTGGTWQGGTIQSGYGGTGLTTFTGANNALYSTSASALAAGTLPVAAGGTGLTSYTLNGVVYASGTGTLTTGSVLVFDGTNLGIGSTIPVKELDVAGSINFTGTIYGTEFSGIYFSGVDNFNAGVSAANSGNDLVLQANSTEQARLTSTGLGIGTSSPGRKLSVSNGGAQGFEFGPGVGLSSGNELLNYNRATSQYVPSQVYASTHTFYTGTSGSTLGVVFDGSNFGLGIAPSYKLHVAGASGSELRWENTADTNRGWRIKATTGVGVNFGTTSGVYPLLFDIDSVTKMTLDTSGNLSMAAGGAIVSSRINPRTSTTTSTATLTPDIQTADQYNLTAQAVGLTIAAPTGTPVDGNKLLLRILDNGTSRALTWNGTYTVIGTTLPTATTANKMVYVGCIYNAANTRWDVIAVTTQV
jgi:hypothetical protein